MFRKCRKTSQSCYFISNLSKSNLLNSTITIQIIEIHFSTLLFLLCFHHPASKFFWVFPYENSFLFRLERKKGQIYAELQEWQLLVIGNPFCMRLKANLMPSQSLFLVRKPSSATFFFSKVKNIFIFMEFSTAERKKWKEIKNSRYVQAITNCGGGQKCTNLVGWKKDEVSCFLSLLSSFSPAHIQSVWRKLKN